MNDLSSSSAPPVRALEEREVFFELMRQEWPRLRGVFRGLGLLWFAFLWVMPVMHHPGWLFALGLLFILLAAPGLGGRDVIDGTEEFSFSQPPGRGPLFLARFSWGLAFLLVFCGGGSLVIAWDLPQKFWSIFFSGGLTESFDSSAGFWIHLLALLVPLAAFSLSFVTAAMARSRAWVGRSWLAGLGVLPIVPLGGALERMATGSDNGLFACLLMGTIAVVIFYFGHLAYLQKDATKAGGEEMAGGGLWWVWLLVGLLVLQVLASFWVVTSSRESEPVPIESR